MRESLVLMLFLLFSQQAPLNPYFINNSPNNSAVISAPKTITSDSSVKKKMILILLDTQQLLALEGETQKVVYTFPISSGRNKSTPTGRFQIYNKASQAFSRSANCWMSHWMAFTSSGRFGIHGLPRTKSGQTIGAHLIGRPASRGCIRLRLEDAKKLFEWTDVGTTVRIINSLSSLSEEEKML